MKFWDNNIDRAIDNTIDDMTDEEIEALQALANIGNAQRLIGAQ